MFPTAMLASATQRKALRVLAERNKRYTIDELAELCQRSPASVSRALKHADRYPFVERDTVPGSKQLTYRLDPDSGYTAALRDFFDLERDRERQNGTVPVDVWNLLEDVTGQIAGTVDGFVELFLFGSYARGDYYAGSDIDLLLVHTGTDEVRDHVDDAVRKARDDHIQVITVGVDEAHVEGEEVQLLETIRERSPVGGLEVLIPLSGEVSA